MEKLVPNRGAPPVPSWFVPTLKKTVDPNLELLWMPEIHRFAIVTPVPHTVSKKMYHVEAIIHRDNNYAEPNMAIIHEFRRLIREKESLRSLDDIPKKMKEEEEEKIRRAEEQRRWMQHDFMKKVYHFLHRKTFVLPGKKSGAGLGIRDSQTKEV